MPSESHGKPITLPAMFVSESNITETKRIASTSLSLKAGAIHGMPNKASAIDGSILSILSSSLTAYLSLNEIPSRYHGSPSKVVIALDFATGAADRVGWGIAAGVVVGSGRGVAAGVGVGVGSDVGVGDGVGLGVPVGTDAGAAVGTGVAVGSGAAEGTGVCFGVGLGVAVGTDAGVEAAVGTGVAVGSGSAVRAGVCVGVGVSAGDTVAVGCGSAAALTVADGAATAVGPSGTRGSATGAVCSPPQAANTITADRNSSSTVAAIPALVSLPHNDFMAPFSASVTVESMTRPIYPPDVRFDSADAGAGGCAPWERKWQKHPPGGEGLSHSPLDGGNHPPKSTCLSSVVTGWQTGPLSPPGYVRQSEDRLCEPALCVEELPGT